MTNKSFKQIRDNVIENNQDKIGLTIIKETDLNNMELLPLLYIMAEITGKDNTVIQQHIKDNFFQNEQEEENLIFYLFLNSLTEQEREYFKKIFLILHKAANKVVKNI